MAWAFALWMLCQVGDPAVMQAGDTAAVANDPLRRSRNEFAFGNYDAAVLQLQVRLAAKPPLQDDVRVQAYELLALSYYLTDRQDLARREFARLLELAPGFELDPFTVAPPIIEMFEALRHALNPTDTGDAGARDVARTNDGVGVLRTVEYHSTERSAFMTYLPFGVGQFYNNDVSLGVFFAATQAAFLAANIGCYFAASSMHGFTAEQTSTLQALTVAQYTALGLFGASWAAGAIEARVHFAPVIVDTPRVQEMPLYGRAP